MSAVTTEGVSVGAGRHRCVARRGMLATAHPLASRAGLEVLADGGNAVDAAIAAVAVLGVVQPMMSGLGGDSFILIRSGKTGEVHSINGSGPAPQAQSLDWAARAGLSQLPERGLLAASVPGAVDAMCAAHRQFGAGRHPLAELLRPAIRHAADGVPIAPSVGRFFAQNATLLGASATTRAAYFLQDHAPGEGEILRQPDLAQTLDAIAQDGRDAFYRGDFARCLVQQCRSGDGLFTASDLAGYRCEVVAPLSLRIGGRTIYTNPPVGQGIVLLEAMGILDGCRGRTSAPSRALRTHRMIEALKLAFADRNHYVGDPHFVPDTASRLIADRHLAARASRLDDSRALQDVEDLWTAFGDGDTTCLAAADHAGNWVAYITSLSTPFGAAEVIDGTGVLMNNRAGRGFSLDPKAPNCLAPGKRTMSTLHVYLVADDAGPRLCGGTSGGDGQPQWNLQILDAVLQDGRDIQEAIDMPRWELWPGTDPMHLDQPFELRIDPRLDADLSAELARLGHRISDKPLGMLGAAQAVACDDSGALIGAADPRADGCSMGLD